MNKKLKITIGCVSGLLAATSIITPVVLITNKSNVSNNLDLNNTEYRIKNNKDGFIYNNRYYESIMDVAKQYIAENPDVIQSKYYLGNLYDATINHTNNLLDIDKLRPYDKSKLLPAYVDSLGDLTYNFEQAKQSYINPGLIVTKYYDFNQTLFKNKEDAIKSIAKSKIPTGVQYYNNLVLDESNTINYNPLSKKDLLEFKRLALSSIKNKLANESTFRSNFKIKMYDNDYYDQNTKQWLMSSKNSNLILDKDLIQKTIAKILEVYFETKLEALKECRFNVNLKLVANGWKTAYHIDGYWDDPGSKCRKVDNCNLVYSDLSFNDLLEFRIFSNRSNLENSKNVTTWVKGWGCYKQADEFCVRRFFGSNYEVLYNGGDLGSDDGTDIGILQKGSEPGEPHYLTFDISPSIIWTPNGDSNFERYFTNKLNQKFIHTFNTNVNPNSFVGTLSKFLIKEVVTNIINSSNSQFSLSNLKFQFNLSGNYHEIDDLDNSNVLKNPFMEVTTKLGQYFSTDSSSKFSGKLNGFGLKNEIIDRTKLNTLFNQLLNKSNFIIEFNDRPLFKLYMNYNKNSYIDFINSKYELNFKINDSDELKYNYNNTLNDEETNFLNSIQNVSQSFDNMNTFNVINNKQLFNKVGDNLKFNYQNSDKFNKATDIIKPMITNGTDTLYPLNTVANTYNKIVDELKKSNPNDYKKALEKEFNSPGDILVLYDQYHNPINTLYREFLSNGFNVSPKLINNNSIKLFNDSKELLSFVQSNLVVQPAEVVIIYGMRGNVMNPGIEITKDKLLSISSDAIFDSEETIVDNILRTLIIPQDPNVCFYKDSDKNYFKVENTINQVYKTKINNKHGHGIWTKIQISRFLF